MLPLACASRFAGAGPRLAVHRRARLASASCATTGARHLVPLFRAYTTVNSGSDNERRLMSSAPSAAAKGEKYPYKKFKKILVANRGEHGFMLRLQFSADLFKAVVILTQSGKA